VLVLSGKGGVGKTTVAAQLAQTMAAQVCSIALSSRGRETAAAAAAAFAMSALFHPRR
jgi:cellulose biosynthesis protein BcsQ